MSVRFVEINCDIYLFSKDKTYKKFGLDSCVMFNYIHKLDRNSFRIKDVEIFGDPCVLVTPSEMSVEWNDQNKIFRSALLRKSDLHPISLGFKKFMNLGEKPDFEPLNLNDSVKFIKKIDGSLAIISKYKNQVIFRTRGGVDARDLETGYEVQVLRDKYPLLFNNEFINSEGFSILCEWTTPNNIICLKESNEPELSLIGIVDHSDYSYFVQNHLDGLASRWHIPRPTTYDFTDNPEKVISDIRKSQESFEGVVIYSSDGQILKKVKTDLYLKLHGFRFNLSVNRIIDLFFDGDEKGERFTSFDDLYPYFGRRYDFECAELALPYIEKLKVFYDRMNEEIKKVQIFVNESKNLDQKDFARDVFVAYPKDWRNSAAFSLRSSGKILPKFIKKVFKEHCCVEENS